MLISPYATSSDTFLLIGLFQEFLIHFDNRMYGEIQLNECKYEELNRVVREDEYDELINYAYDLGIRKAFIQEGESCKESFIPDFNQFRVI